MFGMPTVKPLLFPMMEEFKHCFKGFEECVLVAYATLLNLYSVKLHVPFI